MGLQAFRKQPKMWSLWDSFALFGWAWTVSLGDMTAFLRKFASLFINFQKIPKISKFLQTWMVIVNQNTRYQLSLQSSLMSIQRIVGLISLFGINPRVKFYFLSWLYHLNRIFWNNTKERLKDTMEGILSFRKSNDMQMIAFWSVLRLESLEFWQKEIDNDWEIVFRNSEWKSQKQNSKNSAMMFVVLLWEPLGKFFTAETNLGVLKSHYSNNPLSLEHKINASLWNQCILIRGRIVCWRRRWWIDRVLWLVSRSITCTNRCCWRLESLHFTLFTALDLSGRMRVVVFGLSMVRLIAFICGFSLHNFNLCWFNSSVSFCCDWFFSNYTDRKSKNFFFFFWKQKRTKKKFFHPKILSCL